MSLLDQVNEVAKKQIVPGVLDTIFKSSPILDALRGIETSRVSQWRLMRKVARQYSKGVRLFPKERANAKVLEVPYSIGPHHGRAHAHLYGDFPPEKEEANADAERLRRFLYPGGRR